MKTFLPGAKIFSGGFFFLDFNLTFLAGFAALFGRIGPNLENDLECLGDLVDFLTIK